MSNSIKIQVLGTGCPSCKRLYEITKEAVAEMNLGTEVEYVNDIQKIIEMGVISSLVLAVDSKPIMSGSVPDKEKVKELLEEFMAE